MQPAEAKSNEEKEMNAYKCSSSYAPGVYLQGRKTRMKQMLDATVHVATCFAGRQFQELMPMLRHGCCLAAVEAL